MEGKTIRSIDWTMCCLCQTGSKKDLRCPADQERFHSAYDNLEKDHLDFDSISALPDLLSLACLNDGSGIAKTCLINRANYHKNCRSQYNQDKFRRAEERNKRKIKFGVHSPSPKKTRSSFSASFSRDIPECIVCGGDSETDDLHKASSDTLDNNFNTWSKKAGRWDIYAKLQTGSDAHASDVFYHTSCLQLKSDARSADRVSVSQGKSYHYHEAYDELIMAKLAAYIVDSKKIFPVREIISMYRKQKDDRGNTCDNDIHSSRFASHIVAMAPKELDTEIQGPGRGRSILITHKEVISEALKSQYEKQNVNEDEARQLVKTAVFIRNLIVATTQKPFDGQFSKDCLTSQVPEALLTLINLILQGPTNIQRDDKINKQRSNVASIISQLVVYNTAKRSTPGTIAMRHSKHRETPFPLYVGLKLHTDAKLKHLITAFEGMGLSISYQRERELNKAYAISVSKQIETEGVVVPTNMRRKVFTTSDLDNFDQKKKSNLSKDEFHGTLKPLVT